MKTMLLAVVAAFAMTAFSAPVRAEDAPAGDAKAEKKAKKGGKKKDADKKEEAPAADKK